MCTNTIGSATPPHQCLLCLQTTIELSPVADVDSMRHGLFLSTVTEVTVSLTPSFVTHSAVALLCAEMTWCRQLMSCQVESSSWIAHLQTEKLLTTKSVCKFSRHRSSTLTGSISHSGCLDVSHWVR